MNSFYLLHYFDFKNAGPFFLVSFLCLAGVLAVILVAARIQTGYHGRKDAANMDTRTLKAVRKTHFSLIESFYEMVFSSTAVLLFLSVYYELDEYWSPLSEYWYKYRDILLLVFILLSVLVTSWFDVALVRLTHIKSEQKACIRLLSSFYIILILLYIKVIYRDDNYDTLIQYFLLLAAGRFLYFDFTWDWFKETVAGLWRNLPLLGLMAGYSAVVCWYGFKVDFLLKSNGVIVSTLIAHLFMDLCIFVMHKTKLLRFFIPSDTDREAALREAQASYDGRTGVDRADTERRNYAERMAAADRRNYAERAAAADRRNYAERAAAADRRNYAERAAAADRRNYAGRAAAADLRNYAERAAAADRGDYARRTGAGERPDTRGYGSYDDRQDPEVHLNYAQRMGLDHDYMQQMGMNHDYARHMDMNHGVSDVDILHSAARYPKSNARGTYPTGEVHTEVYHPWSGRGQEVRPGKGCEAADFPADDAGNHRKAADDPGMNREAAEDPAKRDAGDVRSEPDHTEPHEGTHIIRNPEELEPAGDEIHVPEYKLDETERNALAHDARMGRSKHLNYYQRRKEEE
ncbi:MAG: hypothetical protein ACOYBD_06970 [Bilifractor sp.]|jgi:hypothetical protein